MSRGFRVRGIKSRKGFAMTLDAAIAVVIAIVMITGSIFYISQNSHLGLDDPGFITAMDSLAILEKSGGLDEYAALGLTSKIDGLLGGLPYESCIRLTFYSVGEGGSLTKLGSLSREGCGYPEDYAIARRVFISDREIYLAELEGWRR